MSEGLSNVQLLPLQPPKLVEHIYFMEGENIIPLVKGRPKTAVYSKIGVVLLCGCPVISCFGSGTSFEERVWPYVTETSVSATDEDELVEVIEEVHGGKGTQLLFKDNFKRSMNIKNM